MTLLAACRIGTAQPDPLATEPHGAVTSPTSTDQPSLVAEPDDATDRPTDDDAPAAVAASEPLVVLEPDARWPVVTTPIAAAHDGRGWIGAIDHGLVVYGDTGEVQRFEGAAFGDDQLAAIPHGRWVVGARILDVDGRVRFDGDSWCNHLGRFASCRASAFSPDGTTAILAASNQPSTCLRDRGCAHSNSWQGVLARMTFEAESFTPKVRVLIEHEDRRDFVVAASERQVAAVEGRVLSIWPAVGDGEPITVTLEGGAPSQLAWLGDDLVGARWVDTEHTELVVLDGAHGYAPAARWTVEGKLEAMAVRQSGGWIAIGTSWYRARTSVEIDLDRIEIYAPDGIRHARIELDDTPTSLSWSPKGDALFVAIPGNESEQPQVIRYVVRG